jgi:hypothetical protein
LPLFSAHVHFPAASYDINKDGINVAVLTFAKSAYRLGETVLGVVELNEREGRARVLKVITFGPFT